MLSLFPSLLTYSLISATLLRLVLAWFFLSIGLRSAQALWETRTLNEDVQVWGWVYASLHLLAGTLLLLGLFTQIGALLGMCLALYAHYTTPNTKLHKRHTSLLLFAISLSLLFSGAGFFSLDLPL